MQSHGEAVSVGLLTMAYGPQKYLDQAETLARSLRMHMPNFRRAIITDRPASDLFDVVIPIDDFNVPGTLLKVRMYELSPFEHTLFIDSDCIAARNFETQLAEICNYDFTPIVTSFLGPGDRDLWLKDVGYALSKVGGERFPKFNGGVYFFKNDVTP